MTKWGVLALAVATLAACGPKPAARDAAVQPSRQELGQDAPGSIPTGWLEADGPGETALIWRAGPNAVDYVLSCRQAGSTLQVRFEPPIALTTPASATLFLGAAGTQGQATPPAPGELAASFATPVTPKLLDDLANAAASRVLIGDAFTETGIDETGKFKTFAQTCAALTGQKAQP